jgi:hypothetical protein
MLTVGEPLGGKQLVEATFMPDDVPDERLFRRMRIMGDGMLRSILEEGDERPEKTKRAEQRGAERFFANDRVEADLLAARAGQRTVEAIVSLPTIVVAHDSSEFDKHGRNEPKDAGPLRSSEARGYMVHSGAVIDPTCEARIGILYVRSWTRPFPQGKPRPEGHQGGTRAWHNEDDKWFWGVQRAEKTLQRHQFVGRVVHVADDEGSSFNTLAKNKHAHRCYIARTEKDRCIREGDGKLFDYMRARAKSTSWEMEVEEPCDSHARGAPRPRRIARVELRYAPVTLLSTRHYVGHRYRRGLQVWAVYVSEPDAPKGVDPLEWMLLAVTPIETVKDALEGVDFYRGRWGIEDIYKIVKSACHAELATVNDLAGFQRLMAFVWPIAAHIARWTYAARVNRRELALPHVGQEALDVLKEACRYHRLELPHHPWTIHDVIDRLARMGGYERRKDREPGWKVIWRGWRVFSNFWDHLRYFSDHSRDARERRLGFPPQQPRGGEHHGERSTLGDQAPAGAR